MVTQLKPEQIVELKDGSKATVVQTYYTTPLRKKVAVEIHDFDYKKTNYSFSIINLKDILSLT